MWFDQQLTFLDGDDADTRLAKIRAFEVIFLLIMVTEYWCRAIPRWNQLAFAYLVSLAAASLLCTVGLFVPLRRWAFLGLAIAHSWVIWNEFPAAGNHAYLELLICCFCAFLNFREEREQVLFLRSSRWLLFLIFFYAGVQKLLHGYYFHGLYFAYSLQTTESFRPILQPFLSAEEFSRLISLTGQIGDGPYLVTSSPFLVLSNITYLAEIILAPLLLLRKTRLLGVLGIMALLLGIEAAAREVFFGLIFLNALLLFLYTDMNRKLVWVFTLFLLALVLSRVGILPEAVFY